MHASQAHSISLNLKCQRVFLGMLKPGYLYLRQNLQAHSQSMLLLVHNERFEVLVVELVQLGDHVMVSEIHVLIYPNNEQSRKCVDGQITQFKPCTMKLPLNLVIVFMVSFQLIVAGYFVEVIWRLSTEPVGIRAFAFHQRFLL